MECEHTSERVGTEAAQLLRSSASRRSEAWLALRSPKGRIGSQPADVLTRLDAWLVRRSRNERIGSGAAESALTRDRQAVWWRVAHFKFMLDRGVAHLARCFPAKRVVTPDSLGLPSNLPDQNIVEIASFNGYLLVAANRCDFVPLVRAHIAKSSRKEKGCCRVCGLIMLIPNEQLVQERVLKGLEDRMVLDGKKVTYADVHDRDLLVQVECDGTPRITRLPRCPHCTHYD
jgi:hypothetical protein